MVVSSVRPDAASNRKSLTILGSTGSVGKNTIDLIKRSQSNYQVEALTANSNVIALARQAIELKAKIAVVADPSKYQELKMALSGTKIEPAAGEQALIEAASRPTDWVMGAIVGAAGLAPTLQAVRRGATVALANKECLVSAGEIFTREVERHGATLLPVDSEHSAIFQVFEFDQADRVTKIILTASGGPFRQMDKSSMLSVTPSQAIAHPNWDMGAKISVDSATMMNKGLELIEAYHLFPIAEPQIEVLVHPQSVIHSMVEYVDGSVLAQMGTPDMRTPISFAMEWPNRMQTPSPRLSLADIGTLTFELPDCERFPALRLAREALITGRSAPTVLNAVNEVAVQKFIDGKIGFLDIATTIEEALNKIPPHSISSLEDVIEIDAESRAWAIQQS
ncbi:MAG: 1-deoxy-D-xylulose-5-phosphate reductoisomerase [Rhodospirillaceae bacterium TMED8]|nr:1-deoxy-D-xylulose-5-phosphate reductoisomerase [Magnetovibrio sp.]OUT51666.1 MAG: 1-deoxy-D-xylulose-5-phosphate reductoisomerase [Rhodospirillaceae bacterium TMED8]